MENKDLKGEEYKVEIKLVNSDQPLHLHVYHNQM